MKITVIVPTINRPTLARALTSCQGAGEVLLVADGPEFHAARDVLAASGLPGKTLLLPRRYQDYGHTPRNIALGHASGDWIAYLDDDDYFVPDAMSIIRQSIRNDVPHFFQVEMADLDRLVWNEPVLRAGNITTIGITHPNNRKWGLWSSRYEGDYDFAASTAALYSEVAWIEKVIAKADRHSYGA